jgi:hypothetical protein
MVATNIESTDLDFDAIKTKLKTYFAADTQFADYDFEASGLSNILDVLAYNTHFNALTANMAINESFLETAQLRSSVLTHAQSIGYQPRSKTASYAKVTIQTNLTGFVGSRPGTITLPVGTMFTSIVEGVTYTFMTRESFTATDDGFGSYTFLDQDGSSSLKIYEGTSVTRTFLVPESSDRQLYVISDLDMDTSTADVKVFSNTSTSAFASYTDIQNAVRISNTSTYYLIREAPNGYYELQFGDGVLSGLSPTVGNKIIIEYLSTSGPDANGARLFAPSSSLNVQGQSFALTTTTITNASGGAEKQSIESIRLNAPLTYASQKRMVTTDDYRTLIQSNYPTLVDVAAWGGQDNRPSVDYGKVFISIKHPDGTDETAQIETENDIRTNLIEPLATMSMTPEFVDPIQTYMGLTTTFDYNPNLASVTVQAAADTISNVQSTYFTNNLEKFGKQFRRSLLLADIDETSNAILSSQMSVELNQRITPILGVSSQYNVTFPVEIATPDDVLYRIRSSRFTVNGTICYIRNKLSSTTLEIVSNTGTVIYNNVGSYTPSTGLVSIVALNPGSILGGVSYLKIFVTPANQATISPLRNYILELDAAETSVRGNIDYQITRVSL